jgi:hypothetical protein
MPTMTVQDGPHLGADLRSSLPPVDVLRCLISFRAPLPVCGFWLFGLCGEAESREQLGLFGETHTGLSTENLGLFGDHRWTLSVHPEQAISALSIR